MGYGIKVSKADGLVVFEFLSEWSGEVCLPVPEEYVEEFGRKLASFAKGRKKHITQSIKYEGGAMIIEAEKDCRQGRPLISFSYEDIHPHFKKPCTNTFCYDGFTIDELASFGEKLNSFSKTRKAEI